VKKRLLNIIISLIIISLLGITGLQYFWISNAYHIKEAQFDRSVRDAMQRVVAQLETREKVVFLSREFIKDTIDAIVKSMKSVKPGTRESKVSEEDLKEFEMLRDAGFELPPPPPPPTEFEFQINWNGGSDLVVIANQSAQEQDAALKDFFAQKQQNDRMREEQMVYFNHNHRPPAVVSFRKIAENADKIRNIVEKMSVEIEELSKPIGERVDSSTLEKLLRAGLADKGIRVPFEFAIVSPFDSSKMVPIKSQFFTPDQLNSPYPNDVFQKPHYLIVFFHGEKTHILKSFAWILTTSMFFTIVIIVTSIISIFFMIRQKRISDIKTDFINNMTHEFKTPIATISIAADSINNPKVIEEPGRIRDYTKIIKEENQRMNTRVEQVLQMALIDSKDSQGR
jgi:two-component system phosphate regulon sensor histidine kinase PhoR